MNFVSSCRRCVVKWIKVNEWGRKSKKKWTNSKRKSLSGNVTALRKREVRADDSAHLLLVLQKRETIPFIIFSIFLTGLQEAAAVTLPDNSALPESSHSSPTRVVLLGPSVEPSLERPVNSSSPPLYSTTLPPDSPSAILLPRPQAVGSPGHPSPSLGLGNGDGSSSDSLDRQATGQEDQEEDDSSEYENLVSEQLQPPSLTETVILGRPATLWPDGDAHSPPGS